MKWTLDDVARLFGRRQDAEKVLEDPGITEAFLAVRAQALDDFERSLPDCPQDREDAYQRLRALALVRRELHRAVEDHKVALDAVKRSERKTAT